MRAIDDFLRPLDSSDFPELQEEGYECAFEDLFEPKTSADYELPEWTTGEQNDFIASDARAIVVSAYAGTGKTTALVEKIRRSAGQMERHEKILCLSFTNSTKDTLLRKLQEADLGHLLSDGQVVVRTFDSHVSQRMNAFYESADIDAPKYTYDEGAAMMRTVLGQLGYTPSNEVVEQALGLYTAHVNGYVSEGRAGQVRILPQDIPVALSEFEVMMGSKWRFNTAMRTKMFTLQPGLDFGEYAYVFVDEAQDLSIRKAQMIAEMTRKSGFRQIAYLGDPSQSIYGYSGVPATVMQDLAAGHGAERHRFSVSYRCSLAITNYVASMSGITGIDPGIQNYSTASQQPGWVQLNDVQNLLNDIVSTVYENQGEEGKVLAVLARTNQFFTEPQDFGLDEDISLIDYLHHEGYSVFNASVDGTVTDEVLNSYDIILSTIHKAKGQEFEQVFIVSVSSLGFQGVELGVTEEESRIFYTAVTRGKDRTVIYGENGGLPDEWRCNVL